MKDNIMQLVVTFSDDFPEKLSQVIKDEMEVASRKWGVDLYGDNKQIIADNSITQVLRKVSKISGSRWLDFSDSKLIVNVETEKSSQPSIEIFENSTHLPPIKLAKIHEQFIVNNDPNKETVSLDEFYAYFTDQIEKWLRTAVFYGVGSFA